MNSKFCSGFGVPVLALAFSLIINGCSSEMAADVGDARLLKSSSMILQKERNPYLSYEHGVDIKIKETRLEETYKNTLQHCSGDAENNCTILNASINTGDYAYAEVTARVKSEGVDPLIQAAASGNEITRQSVSVDDLSEPVVDNEKRLKMLRSYQDKLKALENRAVDEIESLIKVTSEISKVQSDIERITGENQHLLQRTQFDIVTIHFGTAGTGSVFAPIGDALVSFGKDLSLGIATIITAVAFLAPSILILTVLFYLFRWLWPKIRRK